MTSKEIDAYRGKLEEKNRWIKLYSSYAYGDNYKIKHKEAEPKPDNRIPVPLAKSAVTDVVGYAGRPNEIETEYVLYQDDKEEQDEVTELLMSFDEHNKEGLENSELLTAALSLGISWELFYVSDEMDLPNGMMTPEYKILDNKECWPVWNSDLKPKLDKFLRFWCDDDFEYLDVYYPLYSVRYKKARGNDSGPSPEWSRDAEGDTNYPYKEVPVIPFRINMRDEPIFKAQLSILDSIDSTVSKMENEVDRFNAAIMLLAAKMESGDKQALLEGRRAIFDDLGSLTESGKLSDAVAYLTKNLDGVVQFYTEFLDRMNDKWYETIKVPNMLDKDLMGGDQSGKALRLKLSGLEFLVSEIEVYFRQGLEARFEMYKDIVNESTLNVDWDNYGQKINWKRNLPVDDKEKVEIAAMLIGLGLDLGKVIRFLPNSIVENMSEDEIAQMMEDRNEAMERTLPQEEPEVDEP